MSRLTPTQQQLVASSEGIIRGYVYALIRRVPDRKRFEEDLMQQGYIRACVAAASFDESKGAWPAYLTSHLHLLQNHHREWQNPVKASNHRLTGHVLEQSSHEESYDPELDVQFDRARKEQAGRRAQLGRHSREHVQAFKAHLEGESFSDIGKRLGCSKQYVAEVFNKLLNTFQSAVKA